MNEIIVFDMDKIYVHKLVIKIETKSCSFNKQSIEPIFYDKNNHIIYSNIILWRIIKQNKLLVINFNLF